MKKNKEGKKSKKPKSVPFVIFRRGSFAVHIGDHLRPIWGSFPVWGSFVVGDHLRRCKELVVCVILHPEQNFSICDYCIEDRCLLPAPLVSHVLQRLTSGDVKWHLMWLCLTPSKNLLLLIVFAEYYGIALCCL